MVVYMLLGNSRCGLGLSVEDPTEEHREEQISPRRVPGKAVHSGHAV